MKALTLQQPWAILVAYEKKMIETRSWSTKYRGDLAIHVSKKLYPENRRLALTFTKEPFAMALEGILWDKEPCTLLGNPATRFFNHTEQLNLGCVIATCKLIDVQLIDPVFCKPLSLQELAFGDYTTGRFAWILENVKRLDNPVFVRGMLGLWEWQND
jgi:hypothetical protein